MEHRFSARAHRGFTVIETMIAMAVAGILSSLAYPAYQSVVHKTRRSDAQVALLQVQMAQERHRSNHTGYGTLAEIGIAAESPSGHYTLTIVDPTESGFAVHAAATGSQHGDARCRHMRLTVNGFNVAYASGAEADVANDAAANRQCWSL